MNMVEQSKLGFCARLQSSFVSTPPQKYLSFCDVSAADKAESDPVIGEWRITTIITEKEPLFCPMVSFAYVGHVEVSLLN